PLRSKEEAHDYRYFPEPDLVPLAAPSAWVEELRATLPELPVARRRRWGTDHGLSFGDAGGLGGTPELGADFEAVAAPADPTARANGTRGELRAQLRERGLEPWESEATPPRLAAIVHMVEARRISVPTAKEVLAEVLATGVDPERVVEERGLG